MAEIIWFSEHRTDEGMMENARISPTVGGSGVIQETKSNVFPPSRVRVQKGLPSFPFGLEAVKKIKQSS
jgi:hypothetical protein